MRLNIATLIAPLAIIAILLAPRTAAFGAANDIPVQRAQEVNDLSLRLAVQNIHVVEGQPILIKVDAVNRSPEVTTLDVQTPWDAVQVNLLRDGATIRPAEPAAFLHWGFQPEITLQPADSYTYHWRDPSVGIGDYYPLSCWGFKQLLPAGQYTIYVSPAHLIGRRTGHWISPARNSISNKIKFTIS